MRTHPPPQKAQPVPRGLLVGWSRPSHPLGLPVLLRSPYARMPPPIPRWNRRVLVSLSSPPIAAFPVSKAGRLPHQHFQGLLSVHCTLQPAGSRSHLCDPFHRRLQSIRYLHDCSDCYRLERQLPGGSVSHWVIAPFHGALRVRGFRENRGQVYAHASQSGPIPRLARVPKAPCIGHLGLRFFLRPNGSVPDASCLLRGSAR